MINKFHNYLLKESTTTDVENFTKTVKTACKPWLNSIKGCPSKSVFRGVNATKPILLNKKVRSDRRPLSSTSEVQETFDEYFQQYWGWKPRSTGLFITGNVMSASYYGYIYVIFPIGSFKYLWNKTIYDLYNVTNKRYSEVERLIREYTDKDLCKAIHLGNEIMVRCKAYHAIDAKKLGSWLHKFEEPVYTEENFTREMKNNADAYIKEYLL